MGFVGNESTRAAAASDSMSWWAGCDTEVDHER
jgi:hypothetical protein